MSGEEVIDLCSSEDEHDDIPQYINIVNVMVQEFVNETSDSSLSEDEDNRIDNRAKLKRKKKCDKRRRNKELVTNKSEDVVIPPPTKKPRIIQ